MLPGKCRQVIQQTGKLSETWLLGNLGIEVYSEYLVGDLSGTLRLLSYGPRERNNIQWKET
jgi:hypothetical protein